VDFDQHLDDCVDFTRRLIQTPSMPGEEGAIAALIVAELNRLGYDEVWMDDAGNVSGRLYGRDRSLPALVLNAHLDHVDPGDPSLWPSPPFAAEVRDGRILGRGACDIKGPLAVQVYAGAALRAAGERPRRDVVFSGVVEEEVGGAGAIHWVRTLDYPVELVLLGEPSNNALALGHRGILQVWVAFHGQSVHASVPERGRNPNYALAAFLERLEGAQATLGSHPVLGASSVAPTIIEVDTTSRNVTPAWARVMLDFRTAAESLNSLRAFIDDLAGDWPHSIMDADAQGPLADSDTPLAGYYTPPDDPIVGRVRSLAGEGMGAEPPLIRYQFATDGRHFAPYGLTVLGYSAGEEELAHTVRESISIDRMADSLRGHIALLRGF
jgi:acetylornithine deacetylase/succinyl-diaminopimelate desuccinylase-like protein